MPLGLLASDIVNSFSQSLSGDFAVGNVDGDTIINNEIAFQYQKLLNSLPQEVLMMMDKVDNEVAVVAVNGDFSPTLYAIPSSLRGYVVSKGYSPCPSQTLESLELCWQSLGNQITLSPASISSSGSNVYHLNDTFDAQTTNLVIYYNVDSANLTIASLKSLLRDMVCASLGARIFPVGASDVWSIVTYYQAEADKWLQYYMEGNVPSEFKKLRQLNKKSGITSIKLVRG